MKPFFLELGFPPAFSLGVRANACGYGRIDCAKTADEHG